MTELFLAVDGGNSKTDVVLGTAAGEVLALRPRARIVAAQPRHRPARCSCSTT